MAKSKIMKITMRNADADQVTECFSTAQTIAEVKPRGAQDVITVDISQYSFGSFGIWTGSCQTGMNVKIVQPADVFVIYLPVNGVIEISQGRRCYKSDNLSGYIGDFSRCEQLHFHEGRRHTGIAISKAAIAQQLSELIEAPIIKTLQFAPALPIDTLALKKISAISRLLWDTLREEETASSPSFVESLFRSIGSLLLETVPHNYSDQLEDCVSGALPRHIKRAIEYMTTNISQPLTIGDIATAAGISVRGLQLTFQGFKGMSPMEYARRLRLEGVRKMLINNPDQVPVLDIARQWGFQHMGRFAALYKQAFGELPSQTGN